MIAERRNRRFGVYLPGLRKRTFALDLASSSRPTFFIDIPGEWLVPFD
jgi:hypothetical protein